MFINILEFIVMSLIIKVGVRIVVVEKRKWKIVCIRIGEERGG